MKKRFLFTSFVLFVFLISLSGQSTKTDEYDVYLLIGQSNMAGRGTMIEEDKRPLSNVWILNQKGEVVPAVNPLNQYSTIRKELSMQQINPGNSFSQEIVKQVGRKVLLVVNARGGSSISEWEKGNKQTPFYAEAVRRCKEAQRYGTLRAILWHQGESDSAHPENYLDQLGNMVSHLRKDLKAKAVPFIAGEIAPWHKNASRFNPMIRTISTRIANADYVSSEGTTPLIDETDPHFGRDSQLLLGKRYADKVLKMVYNKK